MHWSSRSAVVVPIKTNNERLPGKNTLELGGFPLYAYLFSTLRELPAEVQVVVDTSDVEIGRIARAWGFDHSPRPVTLDDRAVTGDELLARVVPTLERTWVALLHVTTPFLKVESIVRGFERLGRAPEVDAVFGVRPFHNRFWFRGEPVNHDPRSLLPTQDIEPVYEETNIYFVERSAFLEHRKRVCGRHEAMPISVDEAVDIDTAHDLAHAEGLLRHRLVSPRVVLPTEAG